MSSPEINFEGCSMAVRAHAKLNVLAHEIGHACGLRDIIASPAGLAVSEALSGSLNWSVGGGTGYYSPTLAYRDLTYRCIMNSDNPPAVRADIPMGALTVMIHTNRETVSVGLYQMSTRAPRH